MLKLNKLFAGKKVVSELLRRMMDFFERTSDDVEDPGKRLGGPDVD